MLITDYRALQRTDLRDTGASLYFSDAELDGFHQRALDHYADFIPNVKRLALSIPIGQDTTLMPADFISPEPRTFLLAVGAIPQTIGTYADVFAQSESLQAPMGGMEADFIGNPYLNWEYGALMPPPPVTRATILPGNPPTLILDPPPTSAISGNVFYYASYALPTTTVAGTLPDRQSGPLLAYACYLATEALLGDGAAVASLKAGDREFKRDQWAQRLEIKAEKKLAEFEKATRFRPLGGMA
jgi:hypothetical protein